MNARRDHCFAIGCAEELESELSLVYAATGDPLAGIRSSIHTDAGLVDTRVTAR